VLDVVETPGRHAIACAIGGNADHTLFMCTSRPRVSRRSRAKAAQRKGGDNARRSTCTDPVTRFTVDVRTMVSARFL